MADENMGDRKFEEAVTEFSVAPLALGDRVVGVVIGKFKNRCAAA